MKARIFIWVYITSALLGLVIGSCRASAAHVYQLDLTYAKIINNHDPFVSDIPSKDWATAVQFQAGIESNNKIFYLEPEFHFESAYQKVTTVGLKFEDGIRLTPWLSLMHQHHSRHVNERESSYKSETYYPLYDAIGVRLRFVQ